MCHVRSPDQLGKNAAINALFREMTSWRDVTLTCTEDEMGVYRRSNRRTCISSVSSVQYVRVHELQQYFRVCRPILMPSGHNLQCTLEPYYWVLVTGPLLINTIEILYNTNFSKKCIWSTDYQLVHPCKY